MCRFSVEPRNRVLSVKFVVSTTSVSPSQRPIESPIHLRIVGGSVLAVHPDDARVVDHLGEDHAPYPASARSGAGCCRSSSAAPAGPTSSRTRSGSARRAAGAPGRRRRRPPSKPGSSSRADCPRSAARCARTAARAAGVSCGTRPSGGSMTIDARFWPSIDRVARSRVDPEVVVAADVAGRRRPIRRRRPAARRDRPRSARPACSCARRRLLLELRRLLVGQHQRRARRAARPASASRGRTCPADPDGRPACAESPASPPAAPASRAAWPSTLRGGDRGDRDAPRRRRRIDPIVCTS